MEHSELVQEMLLSERWTAQDRLKLAKKRREQQVHRWLQQQNSIESESNANKDPPKKSLHVQFPESIILLEATARQDFNEVLELLETNKCDPNMANEDGLTPMHQCAIDDNEEILRLLIKYGGDVNVRDRDHWTPLHAAATCGHLEICKILIDHGADLLAMNGDGNMPYDICEDDGTLDVIEYEMDRAGITQEMIDQTRLSIEQNMLNDLKLLVIQNSATTIQSIRKVLSYQDEDGATPLHVASAYGYQFVVDYLIKQNVPLDIRDKDGWAPLHVATFWGHVQVIRQLIESGANIYQKIPDGRSALDLCDDVEVRMLIVNIREQYLKDQEQQAAAALATAKNESKVMNKIQYSQSLNSTFPNVTPSPTRPGSIYESRSSVSSPYDSGSSLNRTSSIRRISSLDRDKVKKFNESFLDILEAGKKIKESSDELTARKQIPAEANDSFNENPNKSEKESTEKWNSETTTVKDLRTTLPTAVLSSPTDTLTDMKRQRVERRRQVAGPFSTEIFPINSPPVAIHRLDETKPSIKTQQTNNEFPSTDFPNGKNSNGTPLKTTGDERKRICCTIL